MSRHENGHKKPCARNRALYCELFGVGAAELGFRVALPGEKGDPEDVDRREFLTGAAGFIASASLTPVVPTRRLDQATSCGFGRPWSACMNWTSSTAARVVSIR